MSPARSTRIAGLQQNIYSGIHSVFAVLGLAPVAGHLIVVWTFLQALLLSAVAIALIVLRDPIVAQFDSIGKFNAVLKGGTLIATHLAILLEAVYARQSHRAARNHFARIDGACRRLGLDVAGHIERAHGRFSLVCIGYILLDLGAEALVVGTVHRPAEWQRYWWATVISQTVCRLRHMQHTMCVRAMTARVRVISQALQGIAAADDQRQLTESTRSRVRQLQDLSGQVHEISGQLERMFGLSQLLNLTQNFVQMSCDLYWMYTVLHFSQLNSVFEIVMGLIPTFLALVVLMTACEDCAHQINYIGYYLHRINRRVWPVGLGALVENYSLQLLHSPVRFQVIGFFNLDFMLLKSMVAAITTYMVILIQFMPKIEVELTEIESNSTLTD